MNKKNSYDFRYLKTGKKLDSENLMPHKTSEKRRKWLRENKEKIREIGKRYHQKNKERINARSKKYYHENKEKIRVQSKEHYQKNKKAIQAQHREYNKKNKAKMAAAKKRYRQEHLEEERENHRKYYQENKDKFYLNLLKIDSWCQFDDCEINDRYILEIHHLFPKDKEIAVILCANHHLLIDHYQEGFCESRAI